MTSYVNSYVEKTHLLRPPLGDVRNQPIKRLMAALNYMYLKINLYICICDITQNFNGHQKLTQLHVKLVNFDEITTYHDKREKAVRSP